MRSHLLTNANPGHPVAVHLAIDGVALTLNAGHRAKHENGAIQHPETSLHLDGEVDVARGVDDVDVVVLPATVGRRALAMVIPRSRSSSIESILAPTPSFPLTS